MRPWVTKNVLFLINPFEFPLLVGAIVVVIIWNWIYSYLCNQCLSPLTLWVWIPLRQGVVDTTLCDKVCQWLSAGQWFLLGTLVSSTNKTDLHDIAEILLKVALNISTLTLYSFCCCHLRYLRAITITVDFQYAVCDLDLLKLIKQHDIKHLDIW